VATYEMKMAAFNDFDTWESSQLPSTVLDQT
jgi:hypothetical protein